MSLSRVTCNSQSWFHKAFRMRMGKQPLLLSTSSVSGGIKHPCCLQDPFWSYSLNYLDLAPAALCMYLISQLRLSWQKFRCTFLSLCWCCFFPNGSSTAGGLILLSLLFNGFKLLLKPFCWSEAVHGALHGSADTVAIEPTVHWRWQEELRELVSQVLLPDTCKQRDAGARKKSETS